MADYVTSTGLEIPALENLRTEIGEELRADVDARLDVASSGSLAGQTTGVFSSHLREAWEAIQYAFSALDPTKAEDEILDGICLITGTRRLTAQPSRFKGSKKITVNLDAGAQVTAGATLFSVVDRPDVQVTIVADSRFDTDSVFTNETGVTDDFDFEAVCTQNGPIVIASGTLTEIDTPTPGLNSVTNATDAIIGRDTEQDEELLARRDAELLQQGGSTPGALKADLLAYRDENDAAPVLAVEILENTTDATDANGLPPHSFEAVIWDGPGQEADDTEISAVIEANKPAGIAAIGGFGTAPFLFSRATQEDFEVEVTLRYTDGDYAGDDAVKAAIVAKADAYQKPRGSDNPGTIPYSVYLGEALRTQGVTRVTLIRSRFSGGAWASHTDLTPPMRGVGVTDTSLVSVLSSPE